MTLEWVSPCLENTMACPLLSDHRNVKTYATTAESAVLSVIGSLFWGPG